VYILIAGGGKVGSNLASTLLKMGHEVTLLDNELLRLWDAAVHTAALRWGA